MEPPGTPNPSTHRSNVFSEPVGGIGFTLSLYPLSLHDPLPATWPETRKNTYKIQNITFCQHVRRVHRAIGESFGIRVATLRP